MFLVLTVVVVPDLYFAGVVFQARSKDWILFFLEQLRKTESLFSILEKTAQNPFIWIMSHSLYKVAVIFHKRLYRQLIQVILK